MNLLSEVMSQPARLDELDGPQWDTLLRLARMANLSARLYEFAAQRDLQDRMPRVAQEVLLGASIYADYIHVLARNELRLLSDVFTGTDFPVVLLKGAAYLHADLPVSAGRRLNDIDILVPREHLADTERLLARAGWQFEETITEYDQRYYREWSHELPPMRHRDSPLELDVHHSLIQPTSSIKLDPAELLSELVPVQGTVFTTLSPTDMVLHSATHLFMSDELRGGLRDLVDMHMLCDHFSTSNSQYWVNLASRAELLGLQRPLYYAASAMQQILGTAIPGDAWRIIAKGRPGWVVEQVMKRAIEHHLAPASLDKMSSTYAVRLLYIRSHWVRMPPLLLVKHLGYKWWAGLHGAGSQ